MCLPVLSTSLSTVVAICYTLACLLVFAAMLLRWITAIWEREAGARGRGMRTVRLRGKDIKDGGNQAGGFTGRIWEFFAYRRAIPQPSFPPLPCFHLIWIRDNPVTTSLRSHLPQHHQRLSSDQLRADALRQPKAETAMPNRSMLQGMYPER